MKKLIGILLLTVSPLIGHAGSSVALTTPGQQLRSGSRVMVTGSFHKDRGQKYTNGVVIQPTSLDRSAPATIGSVQFMVVPSKPALTKGEVVEIPHPSTKGVR